MNFRWSQLRAIGNSTAAKATILVPLVGYLVLFNDQIIQWVNLSSLFGEPVPASATVGWRLLVLYFGLVAVALGTALYALFAPKNHVKYPDAHEFARGVLQFHGSSDTLAGSLRELQFFYEKLPRAANSAREAASIELKEVAHDKVAEWWQRRQNDMHVAKCSTTLLALYNLEDYSHPVLRVLVGSFLVLGLVLLAIPSIVVFCRVCLVAGRAIFGLS